MSLLTAASPPTSSQVTDGILGAPMLSEYALLALSSAALKSLAVSATPACVRSSSVHSNEAASARSVAELRARRTRSTRSAATRAAVWIASARRETSGATVEREVRERRMARRSGSPGACDCRWSVAAEAGERKAARRV